MKATTSLSEAELKKKGSNYDSMYFNSKSYDCALLAAGSLLQVVDTVVNGHARSGVAVIRPPGHHAEEDTACGFCVFNNVSVAAKYAVDAHCLERFGNSLFYRILKIIVLFIDKLKLRHLFFFFF